VIKPRKVKPSREADAVVVAEGNKGRRQRVEPFLSLRGRRAGHAFKGFPGNLGGPDASELEHHREGNPEIKPRPREGNARSPAVRTASVARYHSREATRAVGWASGSRSPS